MFYITGPNDKLEDFCDSHGNSITAYQFFLNNPELCRQYPNYYPKLPAYVPIFIEAASDPHSRAETYKEIMKYTVDERKKLYEMQEQQQDIFTQLALSDLMAQLQKYAKELRKWLKAPLVVTPWTEFNSYLTDKSLFKMTGETFKYGSEYIKSSRKFIALDPLYEDMMARDILNRRLHMMEKMNKTDFLGSKRDLERQIKELNTRIKQQLPKKLEALRNHHLRKSYSDAELRKMRTNSRSVKGARKGKLMTSRLDLLNRSGLQRLRTLINSFQKIGTVINHAATMLNYGVVAYDAIEAYKTSSGRDAVKTFITGASAVYLTSQVVSALGGTTALGGLVIGSLAGDVALGATLLLSSPILGWIVVIVAGAAVAGFIGYQAKGLVENVWDIAEDKCIEAYKFSKSVLVQLDAEFIKAWSHANQWISEFYGKHIPSTQ